MTDLQRRFAEEYVIDYHITNAGKRAGIQGDNVNVTAWQIMQLPDVRAYVEKLQDESSERCSVSKDELLLEFKKVGFANIRDYFKDNLDYKTLDDVKNPEAIKSIKKKIAETESGVFTEVEFVLHDKLSALINMGKHIGFFERDNLQSAAKINVPAPIVYNTAPPMPETE
jgi:phage terminase small subunit